MCITSLPYCPPLLSHKIPALLYDAATSSTRTSCTTTFDQSHSHSNDTHLLTPTSTTTSTTTTWFICTHPIPFSHITIPTNHTTKPSISPSSSPTTCRNLEIRHPGFNGARCERCTKLALAAAASVKQQEQVREAMVEKLRQEIERLEGVVRNMRRKLGRLEGRGVGTGEDGEGDGEGERGRRKEIKEVLEGTLGRGWGGVL